MTPGATMNPWSRRRGPRASASVSGVTGSAVRSLTAVARALRSALLLRRQGPREGDAAADPALELLVVGDPLVRDPEPTGHRAPAHRERLGVGLGKQGIA